MPELGPKDLSFIKKAKDNLGERPYIPTSEIASLAMDYGQKYIGDGTHVVVVRHKDDPESKKVVGFNYKDITPEKAKEIFYLQRFFSTLFPHNFPHFSASAGKDPKSKEGNASGTVRQEIKETYSASDPIYSFTKVEEFCNKLGINIYNLFDFQPVNFLVGDDGGEYYVDTLTTPKDIAEWDTHEIVQYMEQNKYSPKDIEIAKTSIERLKVISQSRKI